MTSLKRPEHSQQRAAALILRPSRTSGTAAPVTSPMQKLKLVLPDRPESASFELPHELIRRQEALLAEYLRELQELQEHRSMRELGVI